MITGILCTVCGGTGSVFNGEYFTPCWHCSGTGYRNHGEENES